MELPEGVKPGQRVLVLAAAGGVGHFAVQFAKAFGAHVVGIAGPSNQDFLKVGPWAQGGRG